MNTINLEALRLIGIVRDLDGGLGVIVNTGDSYLGGDPVFGKNSTQNSSINNISEPRQTLLIIEILTSLIKYIKNE